MLKNHGFRLRFFLKPIPRCCEKTRHFCPVPGDHPVQAPAPSEASEATDPPAAEGTAETPETPEAAVTVAETPTPTRAEVKEVGRWVKTG